MEKPQYYVFAVIVDVAMGQKSVKISESKIKPEL
jgi:hypothetical protein